MGPYSHLLKVYAMIIMINGSFGAGKTTVARLICEAIPDSTFYDPEWVGSVLRRLPRWIPLTGSGTDDFQDINLWRRSVVTGIRLFRAFAAGPVIVPMTFTHYPYLDEIMVGIRRFDSDVRLFCLQASLATVKQRLAARGTPAEGPDGVWLARRIEECAAVHGDPRFGEPIDTEERSAKAVVNEILKRV